MEVSVYRRARTRQNCTRTTTFQLETGKKLSEGYRNILHWRISLVFLQSDPFSNLVVIVPTLTRQERFINPKGLGQCATAKPCQLYPCIHGLYMCLGRSPTGRTIGTLVMGVLFSTRRKFARCRCWPISPSRLMCGRQSLMPEQRFYVKASSKMLMCQHWE